jgi:NSS family neurotransmitter:Na+ symporter
MARNKATFATMGGMAVFGSLAAFTNSTLSAVKVFGFTFFDFYDFTTSNILLPVGGLCWPFSPPGFGLEQVQSHHVQ